jgi:flagellar basal-body rod protein FlgC
MAVEKARLDIVALNLANVNTTHRPGEPSYSPMRLVSGPIPATSFQNHFSNAMASHLSPGVQVTGVEAVNSVPRLVYEPTHPHADEKGFVAYPNINPVSEMITLMETTRSYEANVHAFNAAKSMALKALEIGK